MKSINSLISVWCYRRRLSGCAAPVASDGEIASTENPETSARSCPISERRKLPAKPELSCNDLTKAYDEGIQGRQGNHCCRVSDQVGVEPTLRLETADDQRGRSARARGQRRDDSGTQRTRDC